MPAALLMLLGVLGWVRQAQVARFIIKALAIVCVGFACIHAASLLRAPTMVQQPVGQTLLSGLVTEVTPRQGGHHVVLEDLMGDSLEGVQRVRLRMHGAAPLPGQRVGVEARLLPPPGPVVPGQVPFSLRAWFEGLDAVGYALGPWHVQGGVKHDVHQTIQQTRLHMAQRLDNLMSDKPAAVAQALLVGMRGQLDDAMLEDFRDSGLAHLLAISGLHMTLVAGALFLMARALLNSLLLAFPHTCGRWPMKKLAAMLALAGAGGYLLLAGAPVPTRRAFIMVMLTLIAVMVDRTALSMRLVAVAAMVVLALEPWTLLSPGFQMSFGAVIALIAMAELWRDRQHTEQYGGIAGTIARYGGGLALTTLVASLATAPYALHHFGHLSLAGVGANVAAMPLVTFLVMPAGLLGVVLTPVGLDALPFAAMAWGLEHLLAVAAWFADWQTLVWALPGPGVVGVTICTLGALWTALWRASWRWLGVPVAIIGLLADTRVPPDVLVAGDLRLIAVRDGAEMRTDGGGGGDFRRDVWRRTMAVKARDAGGGGTRISCDSDGCISHPVHVSGSWAVPLVVAHTPAVTVETCGRAALLVVTYGAAPSSCAWPTQVLDAPTLDRTGPVALWMPRQADTTSAKLQMRTAAEAMGQRPWTPTGWLPEQELSQVCGPAC